MVADKTILMIAHSLRLTAEKLEQLAQDNATAGEVKAATLAYVMRITAEACEDTCTIVSAGLAVSAATLSSVPGSN